MTIRAEKRARCHREPRATWTASVGPGSGFDDWREVRSRRATAYAGRWSGMTR